MEKIYALVAKTEKLNYVLVLGLWVLGGALTLVGFPWVVLAILAMHIPETIFIGIPTEGRGTQFDPDVLDAFLAQIAANADSIALCMTYGFLWWMPVKHKLAQK